MEQFKMLTDLRDYIKELEARKGKVLARPVPEGGSPVFYRSCDVGAGTELVQGIQFGDYCFSNCRQWILPHDQMGLSFSAHWQHLKSIHKLKSIKNPGKSVDVYWVLENSDLPPDLEFVPDRKDNHHYFLTVTNKITVDQLVQKLKRVAHLINVIHDARSALK